MTRRDTEEAVVLLAAAFKMRRPRLLWTERARRGRAWPSRWELCVGPKCWRGVEASLVHEMAHLVAHRERGNVRRGSCADHHGPHYADALVRVAAAWYGDPIRYPWHTEYRSLRQTLDRER